MSQSHFPTHFLPQVLPFYCLSTDFMYTHVLYSGFISVSDNFIAHCDALYANRTCHCKNVNKADNDDTVYKMS